MGVNDLFPGRMILRDATATVAAWGEGRSKRLAVNGYPGVTLLVPDTKVMAHLPLAFLRRPPRSVLVLCFGMGTTFRSLASWNGRTTAVELVPSVRDALGFYFADAASLLGRPTARIVMLLNKNGTAPPISMPMKT